MKMTFKIKIDLKLKYAQRFYIIISPIGSSIGLVIVRNFPCQIEKYLTSGKSAYEAVLQRNVRGPLVAWGQRVGHLLEASGNSASQMFNHRVYYIWSLIQTNYSHLFSVLLVGNCSPFYSL